jgi:putative heme-binding domain-containing protein
LLKDEDVEIRITALRALRQHGGDLLALLTNCAKDPSPAVRREVAVALRDVPVERCREVLLTLAAHDDGRFYLEALGLAFEGKEAAMYPVLVDRLGDHALIWSDSFARLMWRLHPVAAVGAFEARAHATSLSIEQRQEAVNTLAFIVDESAAVAMRRIVEEGPEDLRPLAWFWLGHRTTNDWKGMAGMGLQGVPSRTPLFTSGVMGRRSKKKDVDVDITGAKRLWLIVTDAGNGYSCDWADWVRPRLVGDGKEAFLTDLDWSSAEAEWGQVRKNKAAGGGPLMSRGKVIENGIGTHANSVIVYDLPDDHGYRRFQAEVVPDDGGTRQKGGTSIVFEVHASGPSEREGLIRMKDRLLSGKLEGAARQDLGRQLAGDRDGGKLLLDLAKAGKLSAEMKEWLGPLLHRNPDTAVRLMANKEFPRPGIAKLPPIEEIMRVEGSAARGRKHFFADPGNCFACHSFRGEGSSIGPDLTEIAKKFGPAELLDALVNPSGAIAFGYEVWLLELTGGDAVSGFILAEGDILIVKDIAGQRRRILASEVVSRQKLSDSIMPEASAIGLTARQLADLTAFLLADDSERGERDRR